MTKKYSRPVSQPFLSRKPILSFLGVAALTICLPGAVRGQLTEDFSRQPAGRSLYVKDGEWKKFGSGQNAQPSGNTATVRAEGGKKYVTLVARGHDTANARAWRNVQLPVSAEHNYRVSAEIRYATPGAPNEIGSTVNVALNASKAGAFDPAGALSMGILRSKDGPVFFFGLGGGSGARIVSDPGQVTIAPSAWYRFQAELDPGSGRVRYSIQDISGDTPVTVWAGDNAGLPDYRPEAFSQINLMVARPGRSDSASRSADFANITIGP
ncbi:hypothetical protein OpiT1DRAFT_04944 [Opitutaceae bacterium TAV1]|nr:hypothetical protein OpiT1DRAFT_04944 [Opitutaceae bacterium TAV1]